MENNIMYNSIPNQLLTHPNQLTVKQWNDVVNILSTQANVNAEYINNLHKWLFDKTEGYTKYIEDTFFKNTGGNINGNTNISGSLNINALGDSADNSYSGIYPTSVYFSNYAGGKYTSLSMSYGVVSISADSFTFNGKIFAYQETLDSLFNGVEIDEKLGSWTFLNPVTFHDVTFKVPLAVDVPVYLRKGGVVTGLLENNIDITEYDKTDTAIVNRKYVDTKIADLVGSAPDELNTL